MMDASHSPRTLRGDIQGLRAIAVVAVIANHVRPAALSGGFAGVDVFFVISGYLIGLHLLIDIAAGRFSYGAFYGRRVRRLLPALAVVLAAVWGVGWLVLTWTEFADLGKHLVAAALFANNFLSWSQSGYFEAPAAEKPLLHLWSLGVEEQFYLLVPILLTVVTAARRPSIRWVARFGVASLVLTLLSPTPSFYLLDSRFWELGSGVALAYLEFRRRPVGFEGPAANPAGRLEFTGYAVLVMLAAAFTYLAAENRWGRFAWPSSAALLAWFAAASCAVLFAWVMSDAARYARLVPSYPASGRLMREAAASAGLACIAVTVFGFGPVGWPGPQTLFPVLGAGLVIAAGSATSINRSLACRPLVFIGAISYPLYLWHWPALVYWRLFFPDSGAVADLVPVGAAALLAWLTMKFIEHPVRNGDRVSALPGIVRRGAAVACVSLIAAVGAATVVSGGYPARFPPSLLAVAQWPSRYNVMDWRQNLCFLEPGFAGGFAAECTPGRRPGIAQVLLWGDSHAAHLYPGLAALRGRYAFDLLQLTVGGCAPLRLPLLPTEPRCSDRLARAMMTINRSAPDTVVLAGAWEDYLSKGVEAAAIVAAVNDIVEYCNAAGVRHVVLFGPGPTFRKSESADLLLYMLRNHLDHIPARFGSVPQEVRRLDATLAAQAAARGASYVSVIDRFCQADGCRTLADPHKNPPDLMYRDRDHLTRAGSMVLMEEGARDVFGSDPAAQAIR